MPTTARRRLFVPQAIRYFLRQDYPNKELLVVDDGPEPMADLVPEHPQVRYVRLEGSRTLGVKRNLCVEAAQGDLIMHWDDDDWTTAQRISYQVEALLNADAEICGLRQMIFYELARGRAWLYEYPPSQRKWLAGNSLLYTREFWRRSPFPDVQVASDTRFVWSQKLERSVALADYRFYVGMIHPENTSQKNYHGSYWSPWPGDVQGLMGDDYSFYQPFLDNGEKNQLLASAGLNQALDGRTTNGNSTDPRVLSVSAPLRETSASHGLNLREEFPAKTQRRKDDAGTRSSYTIALPGPAIHSSAKQPRVSCILATGNRPAFTRQAIRCFLRQTFDDAELIVVDDGQESVAELCEGLFRVRHVRLESPTNLGQKLNIGIDGARGSIIQKLDDDDFYRQDFLARSVSELPTGNGAAAIVTWDCFNVFIAGQHGVRFSGHGWTTGGTLCFHRSLWEQHQFRDEPNRVDAWFIEDHRARLVKVCAPDLYMLVRHGRNTWARLSNGVPVDDYFRFLPGHQRRLDDLIEPIDQPFYHSLANGGKP